MEIFVTIFYTILFSFIIYRLRFFEISSVSKKSIIAVFILKVIAAISFGIIHLHFYGVVDTFIYFQDSKGLYQILFESPIAFLHLLFGPSDLKFYEPIPPNLLPFFEKFNITYWGYYFASEFMVIRFLTIFNLFTFGYYYPDAVFMAFLSLIGLLYIYKIVAEVYPEKTFLIKPILFGIPSVLFFTSGIHKEALTLFFLGVLLWNFHNISERSLKIKRISLVIIFGILLYTLREFTFVFLLPNLAAYFISMKNRKNVFMKFLLTHLIYWGIIFNLYRINQDFNIADKIVWKQDDFALLKGNSNIPINPLQPNIISFAKNSPYALRNTLIYPLYWKAKNIFQKLASLETSVIFIAMIIGVLFWKIDKNKIHPLVPFCFAFSLSLLILFGLIVPNLGALARYKSISMLFLLMGIFILFNEKNFLKKISGLLNSKKSE